MTEAAFHARIACIEWHANLWRLYGTPYSLCEAMMRYCSEVTEADHYGMERPEPESEHEWCLRMRAYFDRVFSSPHAGPISFS
jgi:hypothetical protein